MIEHDSIGLLLGRFGLSGMQSQLEEIEAAAQNGSWTYRQFLRELFEREEAMRSGQRLKRLGAKGHYSRPSQDDLKRAGLSPLI